MYSPFSLFYLTNMKTQKLLTLFAALFFSFAAYAQDEAEDEKLKISGSVDTYYKYDFSGNANIGTSFANEQNSISIGMVDLILEKSVGKAAFKAEVSLGPRSFGSVPAIEFGDGDGGDPIVNYAPNIQNLYMSYNFTEKLKVTGGYMATFVGYELISPTGNFHYSTSYLFTNGPFQNAGVKFDYAVNDKFAIMAGVFNPWNVYTAPSEVGPSSIGGQIMVAPTEGWTVYLNAMTGSANGTVLDLTTSWELTEKFKVGLNGAFYTDGADDPASYSGAAVYTQLAVSDAVSLGARYEYFSSTAVLGVLGEEDASVNAVTVSANLKAGPITLIPEFRGDFASSAPFFNADGDPVNSAVQALVAAVFAF